jgi:hypothetical protein
MIGHLVRFLAQLDMWMTREADVGAYVDLFAEAEAAAAPSAVEPVLR